MTMFSGFRNRHLLISDLIMIPLAAYASFAFFVENWDLGRLWPSCVFFTVGALFFIPLSLFFLRGYSRFWYYASVEDLVLLTIAVAQGILLTMALEIAKLFWPTLGALLPFSIPFNFFALVLGGIAGPRVLLRLSPNLAARFRPQRGEAGKKHRVLIYGAGDAGEMLVRELRRSKRMNTVIVAFLDDDATKHGMRIHGLPVLGDRTMLRKVVEEQGVDQVIIAIAAASGKAIREIAILCERLGVEAKVIPGFHEMIGDHLTLNHVRDIQVEDLLRREPIQTDISAVRALIHGRRVLVTGGGGSIGSELCRQALQCEPTELTVLGHGENSVFEIHNELLKRLEARPADAPKITIHTMIADIRSPERIAAIFAELRPEIVFHAAAHKHVPLMERNPAEAVTNNIIGTRNLLDAAQATGVAQFVMISSDKAVNPTSVMGTCKRTAELLVRNTAILTDKAYVTVRFGNVLGSRGSVVLTFKKQIAAGGPITVTDPEMRRFFMTIPEAVQLVLQAATMGKGGEVFMLDMGEPIKIVDLARDMIELSGLEPDRDIEIRFTGLRPGEKLYEELFVSGEEYQPTYHQKVFIARNASTMLPARLNEQIEDLRAAADRNDVPQVMHALHILVPEFHNPEAPTPAEPPPSVGAIERVLGHAP